MKDVQLLNGDTSVTVIVPAATDDVRIIVDGPRERFTIVNETNGMHLRFGDALGENERLWIETQARKAYRRLKATKDAERVPCYEWVFIPTAQDGWGWMRLAQGRNTLTVASY